MDFPAGNFPRQVDWLGRRSDFILLPFFYCIIICRESKSTAPGITSSTTRYGKMASENRWAQVQNKIGYSGNKKILRFLAGKSQIVYWMICCTNLKAWGVGVVLEVLVASDGRPARRWGQGNPLGLAHQHVEGVDHIVWQSPLQAFVVRVEMRFRFEVDVIVVVGQVDGVLRSRNGRRRRRFRHVVRLLDVDWRHLGYVVRLLDVDRRRLGYVVRLLDVDQRRLGYVVKFAGHGRRRCRRSVGRVDDVETAPTGTTWRVAAVGAEAERTGQRQTLRAGRRRLGQRWAVRTGRRERRDAAGAIRETSVVRQDVVIARYVGDFIVAVAVVVAVAAKKVALLLVLFQGHVCSHQPHRRWKRRRPGADDGPARTVVRLQRRRRSRHVVFQTSAKQIDPFNQHQSSHTFQFPFITPHFKLKVCEFQMANCSGRHFFQKPSISMNMIFLYAAKQIDQKVVWLKPNKHWIVYVNSDGN